MRIFYLFMALMSIALAFWLLGQTFEGHMILFVLAIGGFLIGLVKAVISGADD